MGYPLGMRWLALAAALSLAGPSVAHADDTETCLAAFQNAQALRDAGDLLGERDQLTICAADSCSDVLRRKCVEWTPINAAAIPSVTIVTVDGEGRPIQGAAVQLDGDRLSDPSAKRELNPGTYTVTATSEGHLPAEVELVLEKGQRDREVKITLESLPPEPGPPPPISAPEPGAPRPGVTEPAGVTEPVPELATPASRYAAYISFGVAGATLIAGSALGIYTLVRADDLETECASDIGCPQSDIDATERTGDAATAMFVISGAAALLGIGLLLFADPDDEAVSWSPSGPTLRF